MPTFLFEMGIEKEKVIKVKKRKREIAEEKEVVKIWKGETRKNEKQRRKKDEDEKKGGGG